MNLYFWADFMVKLSRKLGVRCLSKGENPVLAIGTIFQRYTTDRSTTLYINNPVIFNMYYASVNMTF